MNRNNPKYQYQIKIFEHWYEKDLFLICIFCYCGSSRCNTFIFICIFRYFGILGGGRVEPLASATPPPPRPWPSILTHSDPGKPNKTKYIMVPCPWYIHAQHAQTREYLFRDQGFFYWVWNAYINCLPKRPWSSANTQQFALRSNYLTSWATEQIGKLRRAVKYTTGW